MAFSAALFLIRRRRVSGGRQNETRCRKTPNLTDEMIVGRRPDSHGHLPEDMPRWMSTTIVAIDTLQPLGRPRGERGSPCR